MKLYSILALIALSLAWAQAAIADERVEVAFSDAQTTRGQLSIWGQGLLHTHVRDDSEGCDAGAEDFCEDVLGLGGFASIQIPLFDQWSILSDGLVDFHTESDADGSSDQESLYAGTGLHIIHENGPMPFGVFGVLATGLGNADDDDLGVIGGLGVEIGYHGAFAQAGVLAHLVHETKVDTIDQLYFIRIGGSVEYGVGRFNGSLAGGTGDFDDDVSEDIPSLWLQIAADYEAPLGNTGLNWFVGYQGDLIKIGESGDIDQALMHTGRIGIRIPFGSRTPTFSTPNFRAPVAYSTELND